MLSTPPTRVRYFTPKEADELLPLLSGPLLRCTELAAQLRAGQAELEQRPDLSESERIRLTDHTAALRGEIDSLVQAVQGHGVELKGVEPALVDFPALRHGQEAFLCWREGETRVSWWHPTSTGFRGRRPLDFNDLGAWEWCN